MLNHLGSDNVSFYGKFISDITIAGYFESVGLSKKVLFSTAVYISQIGYWSNSFMDEVSKLISCLFSTFAFYSSSW